MSPPGECVERCGCGTWRFSDGGGASIRKNTMTKRMAWALFGLFLFLPVAGIAWLRTQVTWPPPFFVDCGTLSPDKAFEEVFGRPMPTGVTDIQCAGIPQSGYVWMRLRATDAAIKSMTGGRKPDAHTVNDGLASLL